jgi:hypothetical protein
MSMQIERKSDFQRTSDVQTLKGAEKILRALAAFDYLTASQITRLLYAPSSHAYVRKQLHALASQSLICVLPGRFITLPRVYTLTAKGYTAIKDMGIAQVKRVRPTEERKKALNLMFLQHTLAVSDVLIAARLLSQAHPDIVLTRLYTERQLRRKISVTLPDNRTIFIEPDASCVFTIQGAWEDFFHIEVYRNLPPMEWRFKQKIQGYVTYAVTGQHEALFHTPALSIAVIAQTPDMIKTLKRWTEEAMQEMQQPGQGGRFFFRSINPATATPEDMFLSPLWEQAFSSTKTPLLVLE